MGEENLIKASIELRELDAAFGVGVDTHAEVAKAITIAQLHRDVEAKVCCKNMVQALDAHLLLGGKSGKSLGLVYRESSHTYELPNGSAVSVFVEGYEP